jgi:hypothetical protein
MEFIRFKNNIKVKYIKCKIDKIDRIKYKERVLLMLKKLIVVR